MPTYQIRWTEQVKARALDLWVGGLDVRAIAERLNTTPYAIHHARRKFGWPLRERVVARPGQRNRTYPDRLPRGAPTLPPLPSQQTRT